MISKYYPVFEGMEINILIPNDIIHLPCIFFFNLGSVREYAVFLDKESATNLPDLVKWTKFSPLDHLSFNSGTEWSFSFGYQSSS